MKLLICGLVVTCAALAPVAYGQTFDANLNLAGDTPSTDTSSAGDNTSTPLGDQPSTDTGGETSRSHPVIPTPSAAAIGLPLLAVGALRRRSRA